MTTKAVDHDEDEDAGAATLDAEVLRLGGIRDRMGRARLHEQVRAGLDKELTAKAKKKGAGFKATEVPTMMGVVTPNDIDEAAAVVSGQREAKAVPDEPAAEGAEVAGDGAQAKGPVIDWFLAHPDQVKAIIALLLKSIFGV